MNLTEFYLPLHSDGSRCISTSPIIIATPTSVRSTGPHFLSPPPGKGAYPSVPLAPSMLTPKGEGVWGILQIPYNHKLRD
jgi:hypothetical protein